MSDNKFTTSMFAGGAVILFGVLMLLEQFGYIPSHWFNFWAVVLCMLGIFQMIQAQRWSSRVWGAFLIFAGFVLELNSLGKANFHLAKTWPIFIIAMGVIILIQAMEKPASMAGSLAPHFSLLSCMGGGEFKIRAKNFRGGTATALMGGFDIDLREADMEGDTAAVTLNAFMGGGVLRVPETWAVQLRGSMIMGGNSLKVREAVVPQKTLFVEGMSVLGGFEIRN
jgi:predicted membrane protein